MFTDPRVDDLVLAEPPGTMEVIQTSLSSIFPIGDWEMDNFDYTGTNIKQEGELIELSQKSYVNARLETVDANDLADQVAKQDKVPFLG